MKSVRGFASLLLVLFGVGCQFAQSAGSKVGAGSGEFRINLAGEPATLDPNLSSFNNSIAVVTQLFAGLLRFNQDLTLAPHAAEVVPSPENGGISPDGLTYTFRLRRDLKWSDGTPVTARDFEFSAKRMLDPRLSARYASFYYDIRGAEDYNRAAGTQEQPKNADEAALAQLRERVGVRALDDYTLQFTLRQARFTFLQLSALWPLYPLRADVIAEKGDQWAEAGSLIGNGPFTLAQWEHQDQIVMVPNPHYFGEKPRVARIVYRIITDTNAEFAAYRSGELDATRVPPANVRAVLSDATLGQELYRAPDLRTFALQFNLAHPPFDNTRVRQAISLAVDRRAFVEKVRNGVGTAAYSWIPPGMPGHDPEAGRQWEFNAARARSLLAEAGYPEGRGLPAVAFQYSDSSTNKLIAEFLQGQMKENLGLGVEIEPVESKAFSRLIADEKFQWALLGWVADYPDPDNWLPEIFGSRGGNNHTGYRSPRFDELARAALAEPDPSRRLGLWGEAQRLVVEDAPVVFLEHRESFWLVKPHLDGLRPTAMDPLIGSLFYDQIAVQR